MNKHLKMLQVQLIPAVVCYCFPQHFTKKLEKVVYH